MATYSNQHWLLSHIRNSFISTDDTGMCETVMASDDLPKLFLQKFQTLMTDNLKQDNNNESGIKTPPSQQHVVLNPPQPNMGFTCYPGLDLSDDEDIDRSGQSFDIQMFPEVGAHRFRSNTAQKLEKMDIARRKAARIKCINYEDEVLPPDRPDFFVRKSNNIQETAKEVKSKLVQQLTDSPKPVHNKFIEYARFDGTSQLGTQIKRINVFLSMLPDRERNYPLKICVLATAKIFEVIGLVCYKATLQYPDVPLKSIRHYALYMTEDNDDMEDFPPLDHREPCSKFGFSHLTLAERRPLVPVTGVDYHNKLATKSMTSEEEKSRLAAAAARSLMGSEVNADDNNEGTYTDDQLSDYEDRMLSHNDMVEAPMYRTYRLHMLDKRFFKTEITLGISGEHIEIDQHKNTKFWSHKKAFTTPIDAVAHFEITERRNIKAISRIWLKSNSTLASGSSDGKSSKSPSSSSAHNSGIMPTSPGHPVESPFAFFSTTAGQIFHQHHTHIRFKHYDFESDLHTAELILNKLNCILEVRSSEVRREFLHQRERKLEKQQTKKQLKM